MASQTYDKWPPPDHEIQDSFIENDPNIFESLTAEAIIVLLVIVVVILVLFCCTVCFHFSGRSCYKCCRLCSFQNSWYSSVPQELESLPSSRHAPLQRSQSEVILPMNRPPSDMLTRAKSENIARPLQLSYESLRSTCSCRPVFLALQDDYSIPPTLNLTTYSAPELSYIPQSVEKLSDSQVLELYVEEGTYRNLGGNSPLKSPKEDFRDRQFALVGIRHGDQPTTSPDTISDSGVLDLCVEEEPVHPELSVEEEPVQPELGQLITELGQLITDAEKLSEDVDPPGLDSEDEENEEYSEATALSHSGSIVLPIDEMGV